MGSVISLSSENITIALLIVLIIIASIVLVIVIRYKNELIKQLGENARNISDTNSDNNLDLLNALSQQNSNLRDNVSTRINEKFNDIIKEFGLQSEKTMKDMFQSMDSMRNLNDEKLEVIRRTNEEKLEKINDSTKGIIDTLTNNLERIRSTNEEKLNLINDRVNEKLEKNLNEKLAQNFAQIDTTLQSLQKSLGEITQLSTNVIDLRKTFSNTKSKGIFGEIQLENILENIMDRSQYEKQFCVSEATGEKVDFAIKVPDKENIKGVIYIPIDVKFNVDVYNKILEASDSGDSKALENARKELKSAIDAQAKSIKEKYINPPFTSEFALMFLPSEGIYAEVLRIPNLANECLSKHKVIIVGPTNTTAIINSLSVGFKYLKINENSREIVKLLESVKKQFSTNEASINKLKKHLSDAQKSTDDIASRNTRIVNNLSKLSIEGDELEVADVLGIEDKDGD